MRLLHLDDGSVTKLLQSNKWIAGIGWLSDNIIYSSLGGGLWELALTQPDRAQRLPIGHDVSDVTEFVRPSPRLCAKLDQHQYLAA